MKKSPNKNTNGRKKGSPHRSPTTKLRNLRMGLREKRGRRRILNDVAIKRAVLQDPIHITVSKLCRQIGITRFTFYRRYKSKACALKSIREELIDSFIIHITSPVMDNRIDERSSEKSPDNNKRLINSLFIFMAKNKDLYLLLLTNPVNNEIMRDMISRLVDRLTITWGPSGITPPTKEHLPVHLFIAMTLEILKFWAEREECDLDRASPYKKALIEQIDEARIKCRSSLW